MSFPLFSTKNLQILKQQLVTLANGVFKFLIPASQAKTLVEFANIHLLFDRYRTRDSLIRLIIILTGYILTIFTGLQVPLLVLFKPLKSKVLGTIGYLLFGCLATSFIEDIVLRLWLYFFVPKSVEQIQFVQLHQKRDERSRRKVLNLLQFFTTQITASSYVFYLILVTFDTLASIDGEYFVYTLTFYLIYLQVLRYGIVDPLILYAFAISGIQVVMDEMRKLKSALRDFDQYSNPLFQVLHCYDNLCTSVKQLNSLSKILAWTHNLMVIPLMGQIIYLALEPAEGLVLQIFKSAIISAAAFYTLRGYILISLLSQAHTESKHIGTLIHSIIARRRRTDLGQLKRLRIILEDLSSHHSHLAIREYGDTISQFDTYTSVMSTISIITLLTTLYGSNKYKLQVE